MIPKWLWKRYSELWSEQREEKFNFNEAVNILGVNEENCLKIVSELERNGYIISKRKIMDRRKREYRLIKPEDILFSEGVSAKVKDKRFENKLRKMSRHLSYYVSGDYSVSLYTNWIYTKKRTLVIEKKDFYKWYNYLKAPETFVFTKTPTKKELEKYKISIELDTEFDEQEYKNIKKINGINVISPEALILDLVEKKTETSIQNALAILITQSENLDWEKLEDIAKGADRNKEIGFLLSILNLEREMFSSRITKKFKPKRTRPRKKFPREEGEETYRDVGKKWGIKSYLPEAVVKKVIEDLT